MNLRSPSLAVFSRMGLWALALAWGHCGGALAQTATPTPLPGTGDGVAVTFYGNPGLTGTAFPTYLENINMDFFECSPDPSLPDGSFSGQFTAQVEPVYSEPYTFTLNIEGGARLIVNGVTVINQFAADVTTFTQFNGSITLTALQRVPLEVDWYETTVPGAVDLFWQSPSQAQEIVPMNRLYSGLPSPTATPPAPIYPAVPAQGLTVNGQTTGPAWAGAWTGADKVVWGQNLGDPVSFQALWDSNYFYLGCQVSNPTPHHTSPEPYNDDSVELFLSLNNDRAATLLPDDFHYILVEGTNAVSEINNRTAGVLGQTVSTAYGYSTVLAVPWSTLGVTPSTGVTFGFDVGINLSPQAGCPLSRLRWNGNDLDTIDTREYGQLALVSATATPPPPQGKPYVYSNPAVGPTVHFVYTMAENGKAKIRVWNRSGDLVAKVEDVKSAGIQQSDLDIQSFAAGHYFYRVELQYDSGRTDRFDTLILDVKK